MTPDQKKKAQEINGYFREIIKEYRTGFPSWSHVYPRYPDAQKPRFATDLLLDKSHVSYMLIPEEFWRRPLFDEIMPTIWNTDGLSFDDIVLFYILYQYAMTKSDQQRELKSLRNYMEKYG